MIIILGGVCGTGKTTIGCLLSHRLGIPFYDADDFHPPTNVEKMKSGKALDDDDRAPWLSILAQQMPRWEKDGGAILGCSALKEAYREVLSASCDGDLQWIFLTGSRALLQQRLDDRSGHFMGAEMLQSQLEALELPAYGWQYDVAPEPTDIVASITMRLTQIQKRSFGGQNEDART